MNQTVVYILSHHFSGSHYLSLLLGSHSRTMHAGELSQFRLPAGERDNREVYLKDAPLFEGLGPQNIGQIYDRLFARLGPEIEALVDTSKSIDWAKGFCANRDYQRRYIHLIRDPRALVRRWMLQPGFKRRLRRRSTLLRSWPRVPWSAAFVGEPRKWLYNWLLENRRITEFLRDHRLDANLVTYHDLATDTATEVRRLTEWIGLPFEPGQLEYWNREHVGTQKRAYEWIKEQKTGYFDLRWKTELSPAIQQQVTRDRPVNDYLKSLGVVFSEDGLRRTVENPYAGAWPASSPREPSAGS